MKRHRVLIAPIVEDQIRAQAEYIAVDSIDNALEWKASVWSAIQSLGEFPNRHAIDRAASDRMGIVVRKVVIARTYLLFYTVDPAADDIYIINFRHGARQAENE